jgi:chromosome segregation ATPase
MEVKEELEHKSNQYEKLRIESQDWYAEARKSFAYRDEVDVLRERAERADRLELEVQKLREKLTDAEFYKTRVDELKEDNRMLMETKEMLEDQLVRARKRSDHAMVLETEIIKYKQKLNDMTLERDVDKTKLQELMDENIQLQLATKNLISGAEVATNSPSVNEDDTPSNDNSLSEQLTNNAQSRALKLELENRRLLAALDSMKESSFHESSNKILELEKEKKKLSLKLDQIQDSYNRLAQQNSELENVFKNALEENKKLQDSLDMKQQCIDKQSSDREIDRIKMIDLEKQVEGVQKEKQRIQNLCESIQRRSADLERSIDHKTKEINLQTEKLKDFDELKQQMYDLNTKLSTYERENVNLNKDVIKYKKSLEEKSVDLDAKVVQIEQMGKEVQEFSKRLDEAAVVYDKLQEMEKQNQELMSQTKISAETISTLQKDLFDGTLATQKVMQNLERLGINENDMEKTDINVENIVEKLCKNPETFKTVKEIVINVGKETMKSADMCVLCHRQEIFTVEKNIEFSNVDEQQSEVEAKLEALKNDNQTLHTTNEVLQSENARQKVEVSTLNSQISSLNTQHVALQLANSQLAAEKDLLIKQMEAKRQQYESLQHDQISLQCLHEQLSSEYDGLNSEKEIFRNNIRDLKTENRALKEHERQLEKTIDELRSEIDSTKKETQNLNNLRAEHSKLKDDFRYDILIKF